MLLFCNLPDQKKKRKPLKIEESLFVKIAQNDMLALEELYNLTDKTVYAFAMSILKNTQEAQDVMQETYLKIKSGAHFYQPKGKPLAWILTIVKNLSLMKIRSNKKFCEDSDSELENFADSSNLIDIEDKMIMESLLDSLTEEERQIVILHIVSGMKHIEIAKFLNLNLSTELSKYNRSLKKLKKILMEGGHEM